MPKLKREEIIQRAEDYINYMIDFCNNDKNAEYNQKAVQDFKELQAYMSIYKFGAEKYKNIAFTYIKAVFS